jgi:hypothetical protein
VDEEVLVSMRMLGEWEGKQLGDVIEIPEDLAKAFETTYPQLAERVEI